MFASGQTGTTVTGLTTGEYSLTVTDSSGCTLTKSVTLKGTKKVNSYRYFNICQHQFHNSSTMGYRNIRNMYTEGFTDLTSGNTGCIVNQSIFSIFRSWRPICFITFLHRNFNKRFSK